LAALLWVTAHQHPAKGVRADHPLQAVLMAGAGMAWLGWMAARRLRPAGATTWAPLALMAAAAGLLAPLAPFAISFMAVAALGAGIAFDGPRALGVGAVGVGALVVATLAGGAPAVMILDGAISVVVALMIGASRREYVERTFQAEQLLAERVRADTERDRAAALSERNRIGREVHDVLAHSLGALSVQLDAADALLENGADTAKARQLLQQARRLAVQGLEDTRQAVHALRDEPVALAEQLEALAARDGAELTVTGTPRPMAADAGLALYRAAQEAVTNARKHAPGAPVSIRLEFGPTSTTLTVTNGTCPDAHPPSALRTTGGGFGLQGMRERIELLGGRVVAAPLPSGWAVEVAVPA
jgi:signal transduction histidine kinase